MLSVFGHRNPDSDSICTAIVAAQWLSATGKPATAYRLGAMNRETQFILQYAHVAAPALLTQPVAAERVWLVDFTELEQGPDDLDKATILGVIDHHRLGSLTTIQPADITIRPVGASATVLFMLIASEGAYQLSPQSALLLFAAILSDTVNFTSPTTTKTDKLAAEQLASLAQIDSQQFIAQLLAAKTDIQGLSAAELIQKEAKQYRLGRYATLVSQIEVADDHAIDSLLEAQLCEVLNQHVAEEGYDVAVLAITDLSRHSSRLLFSKANPLNVSSAELTGVISRKKQIIPWLTQQLDHVTAPRQTD